MKRLKVLVAETNAVPVDGESERMICGGGKETNGFCQLSCFPQDCLSFFAGKALLHANTPIIGERLIGWSGHHSRWTEQYYSALLYSNQIFGDTDN